MHNKYFEQKINIKTWIWYQLTLLYFSCPPLIAILFSSVPVRVCTLSRSWSKVGRKSLHLQLPKHIREFSVFWFLLHCTIFRCFWLSFERFNDEHFFDQFDHRVNLQKPWFVLFLTELHGYHKVISLWIWFFTFSSFL